MSREPQAAPSPPTVDDEVTLDDYYEHAPCGYLSLLPDGRILRVNQTFLDWTANSREALLSGGRFADLLTVGGRIYYETHCVPLLMVEGSVREIAVDLLCADGHTLPVLFGAEARLTADGAEPVIRATIFDASQRRSYERQLLRALDEERELRVQVEATLAQVRREPSSPGSDISGLPNRSWWAMAVRQAMKDAKGDGDPLVIAVVEIEHFERYGQIHGHDAADRLLLQVSDVWRRADHDLLARNDGEAFGTPMRGLTLRAAADLVKRLRRGTGAGTEFVVGLAQWDSEEPASVLVARAEQALAADRRRQNPPAGAR